MHATQHYQEYLTRHNLICLVADDEARHNGLLPVTFLEDCASQLARSREAHFTRVGGFITLYRFMKPYIYYLRDDLNRQIKLTSSPDMSIWEFDLGGGKIFSPARAA